MVAPVLALNVCIVPPVPVTQAVKELAANTCQARPAKPSLDGDAFGPCFYQAGGEEGHVVPSLPHITLLQCYVKTENVDAFAAAVNEVVSGYLNGVGQAKEAGTLSIPFRRELDPGPVFGQLRVDDERPDVNVHMPAVAVTSSGFKYNAGTTATGPQAKNVEELHELLVKFSEKSEFVERDGVSFEQEASDANTPFAKDVLVQSFVQQPANDASAKWAAVFAKKLSREKYFPHITIGTALSTAVLPTPPPYEGPLVFDVTIGRGDDAVRDGGPDVLPHGSAGKIVVSQMGNFCSCSNVISVL